MRQIVVEILEHNKLKLGYCGTSSCDQSYFHVSGDNNERTISRNGQIGRLIPCCGVAQKLHCPHKPKPDKVQMAGLTTSQKQETQGFSLQPPTTYIIPNTKRAEVSPITDAPGGVKVRKSRVLTRASGETRPIVCAYVHSLAFSFLACITGWARQHTHHQWKTDAYG